MNIAILLSGRGSNLAAIYNSIKTGKLPGVVISCVITNKEDAAGYRFAKENNIPSFYVNSKEYINKEEYDKAILKILKENAVELVCLAGYMKLVSKVIINEYYGKIINIHPSLLPSFPGLDAQIQAYNYGVKISGCTVHFVDEGMDTGPVILQKAVDISHDTTIGNVIERILCEEHILYTKAIKLFSEGKIKLNGRRVEIED